MLKGQKEGGCALAPALIPCGALGSEVFSLHDPWNRRAEEAEQKERSALG